MANNVNITIVGLVILVLNCNCSVAKLFFIRTTTWMDDRENFVSFVAVRTQNFFSSSPMENPRNVPF